MVRSVNVYHTTEREYNTAKALERENIIETRERPLKTESEAMYAEVRGFCGLTIPQSLVFDSLTTAFLLELSCPITSLCTP